MRVVGLAEVEIPPDSNRLVQKEGRLDLAMSGDADRGEVERGDPFDQTLGGTGIGEIALGHNNAVG